MTDLAGRLARKVHPDPDARFIASVAADTELMAVAKTDIEAAAQMLIDFAIDSAFAYIGVARGSAKTAA